MGLHFPALKIYATNLNAVRAVPPARFFMQDSAPLAVACLAAPRHPSCGRGPTAASISPALSMPGQVGRTPGHFSGRTGSALTCTYPLPGRCRDGHWRRMFCSPPPAIPAFCRACWAAAEPLPTLPTPTPHYYTPRFYHTHTTPMTPPPTHATHAVRLPSPPAVRTGHALSRG